MTVSWILVCFKLLAFFSFACRRSECSCTHLNVSYDRTEGCVPLPIQDMATRKSLVFYVKPASNVAIGLAKTGHSSSLVRTVWLQAPQSATEMTSMLVILTIYTCGNLTNTSNIHSRRTFDGDPFVSSPFWVKWDDTSVHVGRGRHPGDNVLQAVNFQSGLNVQHVFVGELRSNKGFQIFFEDAPFASSSCVLPEVIPGATSTEASISNIESSTPDPAVSLSAVKHPVSTDALTTVAMSVSTAKPEAVPVSTLTSLPTTQAPGISAAGFTTVIEPAAVADVSVSRTADTTTFTPPRSSESTTVALRGPAGESTTVALPESAGESTTVALPESAGESTTVALPESAGESTTVALPESAGESTTVVLPESTGESTTVAQLASPATESQSSSPGSQERPATSPRTKRCKCIADSSPQNRSLPTDAEKHLLTAPIVKELTITLANTSAWARERTSATDNRVSSGVLGSAGVVMCLVPIAVIGTMDLLRFVRHLKQQNQSRHEVQK